MNPIQPPKHLHLPKNVRTKRPTDGADGSFASHTPKMDQLMIDGVVGTQDALAPDTVYLGHCVDVMSQWPDASFDLIFADPPYNLQLSKQLRRPDQSIVEGVDHAWDRFENFAAYDAFSRAWLAQARRLLKPTGSLWVVGSYHNIFRLGTCLQDLGFWLLNDVVWCKTNPMPNFRGTRFTNAHETLIWAARSRSSKYTFNYQAMKSLGDGTQMRSDWHLPICQGSERLRGVEVTVSNASDDNSTNASAPKSTSKSLHPTQKPEALLYRIIMSSTDQRGWVLDPFFGTGTTGAVAKRLGRHYVGIEQDPLYAQAARARIADVQPVSDPEALFAFPNPNLRAARIPFGELVESGLIAPGCLLEGPKGVLARVRADGSLEALSASAHLGTGSIHQLAARALGLSSANGWDHWWMQPEPRSHADDASQGLIDESPNHVRQSINHVRQAWRRTKGLESENLGTAA